jgi:hypothetical protein
MRLPSDKIAPLDSYDSMPRNAQIFFDRIILTLARLTSAAWSARRGVLEPQHTGRLAVRSALSPV